MTAPLRPAIHFGDCEQVMRDHLPDQSVDLIMTSPPYAEQRAHTYGGTPAEDYVDWWLPRAEQMKRVLTPTGSLVVNIKEHRSGGQLSRYVLDLTLAMLDTGWTWIDELIWHKPNAFPGRRTNALKASFERLLHFAHTPAIKFHPEAVKVPSRRPASEIAADHRRRDRHEVQAAGSGLARKRSTTTRAIVDPGNLLTINTASGWRTPRTGYHSAVFPEELPAFFVALLTDPEDIVLDPFLGSGTTYRVAHRMGRNPIGIELHPTDYLRQLAAVDQGRLDLART